MYVSSPVPVDDTYTIKTKKTKAPQHNHKTTSPAPGNGRTSYNRPVTPDLDATLKRLPDRPGVYLMKDARGTVLYVGKAQSLRSRVRSYWQKQTGSAEIHLIRSVIDKIADLEYTMTDSVSEALLLEINLVKRYRPRYNVRLKDDKSYPFIKITLAEDFPRVERTRRLPADGSRYFGPYASASSVDEAMNLIRRLFPFRTCTLDIHEGRAAIERPCLLYHIKRCQAPCVGYIGKADYRAQIEQIERFLEGRQEVVARALTDQMHAASEATEYERAAALRDKVRAIERTMESQKMAAHASTEEDVLGLARQDNQAAVQLFAVRGGKMVGRDVFLLDAPRETDDATVLEGFVLQYYDRATSVPPAVLLPALPEDASELEAFLTARRGAAVHLRVPRRGEKRELLELATRNATETLAREHARWLADQGKTLAALEELAEALGLAGPPLPDRVLRHQQLPGRAVGRQHGRLRGGPAADRRVPPLPDQDGQGRQRLRQPPGSAAAPLQAGQVGRRGERGGAALAAAGPRRHRRRQGPAVGGEGSPRRAGLRRSGGRRAGQGARGDLPAGARSAGSAAHDVAGALPDAAAPRRGPPLRDHVPPLVAGQGSDPLRVRRPAGRGPQASGRAAARLRLGQARPRGAAGADCRGAWYRVRVGGQDQNGLGGVGEGAFRTVRRRPARRPVPYPRAPARRPC